jgi:hypothetical protein
MLIGALSSAIEVATIPAARKCGIRRKLTS